MENPGPSYGTIATGENNSFGNWTVTAGRLQEDFRETV
jgi:hypothetical protein